MDIFVKRDERIDVAVWVWEGESDLEATSDSKLIPEAKATTVKKLFCRFRKPNFADSNVILQRSRMDKEDRNLVTFQEEILRQLLVAIVDGEVVTEMTSKLISEMHASVARAASSAIMDKITF